MPARSPAALPLDLVPMKATLGTEVPPGEGWVYEVKYDGVRVLAHAAADEARLVTRNGREKTGQFPEVVAALREAARAAGHPLVLDGELVALVRGRPARFQEIQDRVHLADAEQVRERSASAPAALVVFDLLADGGEVLLGRPWSERRARLEACLGGASPHLRVSEVLRGGGARAVERARSAGWEGVIAKRTDGRYRPGKRSDDWLKLKVEFRQEFVVGGWTDPQRSRPHLGSLLVGYFREGELVFAGGVGTGFDREGLRKMRERLDALAAEESPFRDPPRTRVPAHWVRPETVVELKFAEWTADGRLRQPVFLGLRDDKDAREVGPEGRSVQAPGRG
ncbi:MAG TPA: non-homologous end-joining DNA ligase [Longimicrobiaceae bacterium]|nr:non-homologous end-joining DNA ligase [Longimicrobiaceae bacterium]